MPGVTTYDPGVPSWVDLASPDREASLRFYEELFGWDAHDQGEHMGHYTMMRKEGRLVAGISNAQQPGPPQWAVYVNVDDADAVANAVTEAGGTVVFGPMDVMDEGRMVVFRDTTGALCAGWQPAHHKGAELVNEGGAFCWNELSTSDLAASKDFYGRVFGWSWGGVPEYAEAQAGGRAVAGVAPLRTPSDAADSWLVYFGADDVDAAARRAAELGARVLVEPTDIPGTGRFSVLADPQGAAFALFKG